MKKTTFLIACFVAASGFMNAQSPRTLAEMPNTTNNPERTVQLPAAYFNATTTAVGDVAEGMTITTEFDLNVKIPFTGTYGDPGNNATNALLFDSGPHFNIPGPPKISQLQDATLGMGTYGFACHPAGPFTIADDFILAADSDISSIDFYGYQTGSAPPTINEVYVQIWDGDPSAGGSVVWGDMTNDRFDDAVSAETYRQLESAPGDTSRTLQLVTANTAGLSLTAGTYWVEYMFFGSGASGPWAPPIVITGSTTTGNALQSNAGAWAPLIDIGPQGMPFQIYGTETGGTGGACEEENPNDFTFENGLNCSSAASFKTANDVTVAAGEKFTLKNITASIFANGGITNVDVFYFSDAAGLPGTQIGAEASVTIDDQNVIGNNFGFDVNEIELSVAPFVFQGQVGVPTTYWIQLSVTDGSASGSVFWVITTSSMIGNPTSNFDGGWQIYDPTYDGVYIWGGDCGVLSVADNALSGFNYYPNPTNEVMHLSAAKNIESVAVYNLLGQKVMTTIIGATSSDLNLSGLATGTYVMKVTVEGQTGTYKIVKN